MTFYPAVDAVLTFCFFLAERSSLYDSWTLPTSHKSKLLGENTSETPTNEKDLLTKKKIKVTIWNENILLTTDSTSLIYYYQYYIIMIR